MELNLELRVNLTLRYVYLHFLFIPVLFLALNKVDRLYDWRRSPHASIKDSLKKQKRNTADHFNERLTEIKLELNTQAGHDSLVAQMVIFIFSHLSIL